MNNNISIMLGRLTPPKGRGVQFYPNFENEIEEEFNKAKLLGLDSIEWLITSETIKFNSFLMGMCHYKFLKDLINSTGISINSICLDYLKDLNFYKLEDLQYAIDSLKYISVTAKMLNINMFVIPIFEKNMNIFNMKCLLFSLNDTKNFKISFEFLDASSPVGTNFIKHLYEYNQNIGCCFDIGNNFNRDILSEIKNYNTHNELFHIHIKDKNSFAQSCQLGEGIFHWKIIFNLLKTLNYKGDLVLEVARGKAGDELATVKKQMKFIKELM